MHALQQDAMDGLAQEPPSRTQPQDPQSLCLSPCSSPQEKAFQLTGRDASVDSPPGETLLQEAWLPLGGISPAVAAGVGAAVSGAGLSPYLCSQLVMSPWKSHPFCPPPTRPQFPRQVLSVLTFSGSVAWAAKRALTSAWKLQVVLAVTL